MSEWDLNKEQFNGKEGLSDDDNNSEHSFVCQERIEHQLHQVLLNDHHKYHKDVNDSIVEGIISVFDLQDLLVVEQQPIHHKQCQHYLYDIKIVEGENFRLGTVLVHVLHGEVEICYCEDNF